MKDSCIELKFIHHPGPPMYSDIYSIDKANLLLDSLTILEESKIPFDFWFKNDSYLFEKTLILVSSDDWSRKKKKISKGLVYKFIPQDLVKI